MISDGFSACFPLILLNAIPIYTCNYASLWIFFGVIPEIHFQAQENTKS
jgi:hypothetical protein